MEAKVDGKDKKYVHCLNFMMGLGETLGRYVVETEVEDGCTVEMERGDAKISIMFGDDSFSWHAENGSSDFSEYGTPYGNDCFSEMYGIIGNLLNAE